MNIPNMYRIRIMMDVMGKKVCPNDCGVACISGGGDE